jgi:hypothetical protein
MVLVNPEIRQRVRTLAEGEWGEPVVVVFLDDVAPEFDVPGRRKDGTGKGQRLVRRFLWNLVRAPVGGLLSVWLSVAGGGGANMFARSGKVTGPAGAQALGLVDAGRRATAAWLVHSPSHVGIVDAGHTFRDPKDSPPPAFLWQAAAPDAPVLSDRPRRLSWPDGSVFTYELSREEADLLKPQG